MGIPVKLDVFDGPLDLLLHLIENSGNYRAVYGYYFPDGK